MFLFLEFIIINSIIKLEYKVNAIELSLKKIMGYNTFQKNKKIMLMSILTTFLSIGISIVISIILKTNELYCLALGGIVVLSIELTTIIYYVNKIEKYNIQRILKGENL